MEAEWVGREAPIFQVPNDAEIPYDSPCGRCARLYVPLGSSAKWVHCPLHPKWQVLMPAGSVCSDFEEDDDD